MLAGPLRKDVSTTILCIIPILAMSISLAAESAPGTVVGRIASLQDISVNGSAEPAGRVVLSGELISARNCPALVTLKNGGNVLLTQGTQAAFTQTGNILSIRADKGTIGFRFLPGEEVRIETASHDFIASNRKTINVGEIEVGGPDRERMSLNSGSFSAVEKSSGSRYEVVPTASSQVVQQITGRGTLTRGRNSLTDESQNWSQSLAGKCVTVGAEQHRIIANTQSRLMLEGTWALNNGAYDYVIAECPVAAKPSTTPPVRKAGMSTGAKAAIGILAGGGAAGIAGYLATKSKSGS